jgi:hypothetical protein
MRENANPDGSLVSDLVLPLLFAGTYIAGMVYVMLKAVQLWL